MQALIELKQFLIENTYSKVIVLTDSNTKKECYPLIHNLFEELQIKPISLCVEAGEQSKQLPVCNQILEEMTHNHIDRNALMINLGGGMISDLGGFIASIYKRGIDFVNVPTSLLAMVDAAIGGKCGIDFLGFKNQIGVFKNASRIFIHLPFLESLAIEERKSGFAEMLKHALIVNRNYWEELKKLNSDNWQSLLEAVAISFQIKSEIVSRDPKEKGERKKLNFGHTIGHAIESFYLNKSKPIPHGYAIAAGMYCESYISMFKANLTDTEFKEIHDVIGKHFPKLDFTKEDLNELIDLIGQDKKRKENSNRLTLLETIGSSVYDVEVSDQELLESLNQYVGW